MQLPIFYEENLPDSAQFTLSEDTSRHAIQVLRMKEGENMQLTNGKGYLQTVEVISAHKKNTLVKIVSQTITPPSKNKTSIAISFIKNTSRFEWFLEKATEIGVTEIIPVLCKRTEKSHFRADRMKTILISAMLQSRQAWLPELLPAIKINELIETGNYAQKFIAHCLENEKKELRDIPIQKDTSSIILIGPEGDFTEEEIAAALQQNYIPVSLGDTRLRTETAGMVAAVLMRH